MELRGDNYQMTVITDHESVLSGPRDTGKTIASCFLLHTYASVVPGCQLSLIRKTQASMAGTVLRSWHNVITGCHVKKFGNTSPYLYEYPNGSLVAVGGMDKPGKVLSGERDAIYVNQAEELTEGEWETLAGCCSGRGAKVQHPRLFGDCNPGPAKHWIKRRSGEGKLRLLCAKHVDNPELYSKDGVPTDKCEFRLAVLKAQTGVRYKRYFEGIWATAEGAVYEMFDALSPLYVVQRDPAEMKRWFLALDEGFVNPWVVLLIGADADNRWHVFKEFYKRGVLQKEVVEQAKLWSTQFSCELAAVDAQGAELIASLNTEGVNAKPGKGDVDGGIHNIQDRLGIQADGRTRLTVDPSCVETINEFESYIYKPGEDKPKKENDHAMDAIRYLGHVLGELTGAWNENAVKQSWVGGATPGLPVPRLFEPRRFVPRQWPGR